VVDVSGPPRIFLIDAPTPDVSSTQIRVAVRAGSSLDGLVPPAVERYVRRHGLYTA
jgi:nicotinic acid mononucleotide adenylyltransferase